MIDRRYADKTLIIVDLSFDPTYAEILVERFGRARDWAANHPLLAMA